MKTIDTPIISVLCSTIMNALVELTEIPEKNQRAIVTTARPGITSHFGPYLSNNRPMIGDINPLIIPPGSNRRPALKAE
ncbi:hypothetical protein D3C76_1210930 [compost metagenome]